MDNLTVRKTVASACANIVNKARNSGVAAYIFWGILSAVFNLLFFKLMLLCGLEYWLSNLITLVALKFFVFITNKIFVFKTKSAYLVDLFKEMIRFLGSRIFTSLIDYLGLILLVEVFHLDIFYSKTALVVVVVSLNFFLSKLFVFRTNTKID